MSSIEIPDFCYCEQDYIFSAQTWEEFKKSPKKSKFDNILSSRWQNAMDNNLFNYFLSEENQQKRIITGKENYIIVLNLERALKRRQPECIEHINEPFNPDKFNFTKIKPEEILMNFCPSHENENDYLKKDDVKVFDWWSVVDVQQLFLQEVHRGQHQIIINTSPFEFGHCLLVPDVSQCIPQKATLRGVKLSIEMILLSSHPGFRVGFNGLCAMASVNHQHIHGWYLNHQLRVEYAPVEHLAGICYQLVDLPSKGFVFQLHENTVDTLASAVFAVANYLQMKDVAHNIFMTRATLFGEDRNSTKTTVRVYVWPRKHYRGQKDIPGQTLQLLNVAVAELAGHVPIYFPERFHDLTEAEIINEIREAMLPEEKFKQICENIKLLMQAS